MDVDGDGLHPKLAAYARTAIEEASALQAELIARGLSATFLADLNALLTAFEAGEESKIGGLQTQVGARLALFTAHGSACAPPRSSTRSSAAYFRNDPVKLAVWKHARHVERPAPAKPTNPPDSEEFERGSTKRAAPPGCASWSSERAT